DAAVAKLNTALALQYRSAIEHTVLAGALTGIEYQPLAAQLSTNAAAELDDARRIVEKVVAIGGTPATDVASFDLPASPLDALRQLIDHESEALAAFHAVIPDTGQEPRSEAMEHRLEHLIMRKQEQVDALRRAVGQTPE
ncbi:MAG TPA: ferritin-like domain-containing protein, partial [Acidimicrobiales bacterium]|nr:ferritin-like domain-containing protein [Acidimicrobiales bacterium]